MDTAEVKKLKLDLRNDLVNRIRQFQEETGCTPEIDIGFVRVEQLGGHMDAFPSVQIKVYL